MIRSFLLKVIGSIKLTLLTIVLSVAFVIIAAYALTFFDFDRKNYLVDSTWKDGVGTLTVLQQSEGGSRMKYMYNSTLYDEYGIESVSAENNIIGEKYAIKINPKMPDKYVPIDWKPLFEVAEETGFTEGTAVKIFKHVFSFDSKDSFTSYFSVRFTYAPAGWADNFERSQSMPPKFKTNHPDIKVGQKFWVQYLKSDPQRAIIYIDSPVVAKWKVGKQ